MAQTYQVDITALARHHHATTPQSQRDNRGGGSGFGLAPSISGYEFQPLHPLVHGTEASHGVAMVKVDQPWAYYSLADDCGGRFKLLTEEGRVIVDEEGYAYIVATGFPVDIADVSFTILVRVEIGVTSVQYDHGFQILEAAPDAPAEG